MLAAAESQQKFDFFGEGYYNRAVWKYLSFPIFCNNRYFSIKRFCCLWQHRHLAQKVSGKRAFRSAFLCKVFPSRCDGNLLVL